MRICQTSRWAKLLAGISRRAKKRKALLALELLPTMINDVVLFSEEHLEAGANTAADKERNDKSDGFADEGVEKINVGGFVVLGEWIADRHDKYKKLMKRIMQ